MEVCSANIAENGICLLEQSGNSKNDHIGQLTVLIQSLLQQTNTNLNAVDAVAISSGPGSYTGLRIGISTAKGICHALNKPLIAINTLESMAEGAFQHFPDINLFCPLIDARRMEVYTAIINRNRNKILQQQAIIFEKNIFKEHLDSAKIIFFGSGLSKGKKFLNHHNALFFDDFIYSSINMITLSQK